MTLTSVPSSPSSSSNTNTNVEAQRTNSTTHVSSEHIILNWTRDKSLSCTDKPSSILSALSSSNDNNQRGDLVVKVENLHRGLHFHTEEFLETSTLTDSSGFAQRLGAHQFNNEPSIPNLVDQPQIQVPNYPVQFFDNSQSNVRHSAASFVSQTQNQALELVSHNSLHPLVHNTYFASQQKRKKEEEDENLPPTNTTRPCKRQMLTNGPSSAGSEIQLPLPRLDSLALQDPRKKEPYKKLSPKEYKCEYPVGGNETCGVNITLDKGGHDQRNWKRHLRTHAKKEEQMLESGMIDVNSDQIYALLWADKLTVRCPETDCTFSAKVWRTDGVLDKHLAAFHPEHYLEKMEHRRQKGRG
ncbi:hypothetical protein Clacol_004411 [Clathrus columnatus]|uniref:C2H2-type domain-containing protein n=1 Tax=Clathrus columnatus TaxID=1419009 RepID=A0AAV5A7C9_9AGAM|nr:hypothetical protein Clacol_004411 [Clathrus columnatus]